MDIVAAQPDDRDQQTDCADMRVAPRITMLIRPAKVTTLEGEFVCVIRDVSATGVSVRLFHSPPIGQRATLETEAGQTLEMERVWVRGTDAGFRFADPIDVAELISGQTRFPKRKLRLKIELPVIVSVVGKEHHAIVRNLSQQGARIECDERIAIDQIVRVRAENLPEVRAKVRWRRGRDYGLVFEDTFLLAEFAELAAMLQSPSLMSR